uniref:Putative secreted peptide n=1 Tax=Anopheles braziliensis TaxID=58242 RepID=A0A2M3ZTY0_9DIPT
MTTISSTLLLLVLLLLPLPLPPPPMFAVLSVTTCGFGTIVIRLRCCWMNVAVASLRPASGVPAPPGVLLPATTAVRCCNEGVTVTLATALAADVAAAAAACCCCLWSKSF